MNKKVVICCGISGSGKSTMAKKILTEHFKNHNDLGIICSADEYWIRPDGLYDWNPKNIGRAHDWCKQKFKWYLQEEYNLVIVDNTNLSKQERKPYEEMAAQHGYVVEIREPDTEWKYNALECSKRNVHGVPLEACDRMLAKLKGDKNEHN